MPNYVQIGQLEKDPMDGKPSSAQIRGARAMLDWSMAKLAEAARVSVSTVKRVQDGAVGSAAEAALPAIRDALETAGVRFLPDDGHGAGLRIERR